MPGGPKSSRWFKAGGRARYAQSVQKRWRTAISTNQTNQADVRTLAFGSGNTARNQLRVHSDKETDIIILSFNSICQSIPCLWGKSTNKIPSHVFEIDDARLCVSSANLLQRLELVATKRYVLLMQDIKFADFSLFFGLLQLGPQCLLTVKKNSS
jgi:hypothetical protein